MANEFIARKGLIALNDSQISASLEVVTSLTASGLRYPDTDGINLQVIKTDGNGNLSFGYTENTQIAVKNVSGGTIFKGTPCYVTGSGTSGNLAGIIPADASDFSLMPAGIIAGETITDGEEGVGLVNGFISGVDTSDFSSGDTVYVAVGGGYTNVKPTGSGVYIQKLGNVEKVHSSNGSGLINGPGYYNDLPNWEEGKIMVGTSTYPTTSSVIHIDETNGNIGIGLTNPQTNIHISSSVSASTYYGDGSNLTGIDKPRITYLYTSSVSLAPNNTPTGYIEYSDDVVDYILVNTSSYNGVDLDGSSPGNDFTRFLYNEAGSILTIRKVGGSDFKSYKVISVTTGGNSVRYDVTNFSYGVSSGSISNGDEVEFIWDKSAGIGGAYGPQESEFTKLFANALKPGYNYLDMFFGTQTDIEFDGSPATISAVNGSGSFANVQYFLPAISQSANLILSSITASYNISSSGDLYSSRLFLPQGNGTFESGLVFGEVSGDSGYIYDDGNKVQIGYNDTDVLSIQDTVDNVSITGNLNVSSDITGSDIKIDGWGSVSASLASAGGGGGATTLNGLSDVNITSVADGDLLRYNGIATEWQNTNLGLSLTPTLSLNYDTSSIFYFLGSATITNYDSYSLPSIYVEVKLDGNIIVPNSSIFHDGNGNLSWSDPSGSANTGSRVLEVQVQDFGDLASEIVTGSYGMEEVTFRYFRFETTTASSHTYVRNFRLYTAAGQSGTSYPPNMTSNTTPSPYVASSNGTFNNTTYAIWKAFDNTTNSGWWNLGLTPYSGDWLQIDLGSSITIKSIQISFNSSYIGFSVGTIYGSNTGDFTGEETTLATFDNSFSTLNLG